MQMLLSWNTINLKNLSRFKDVELQVTVETNGEEHISKIAEAFKKEGYDIVRENTPM